MMTIPIQKEATVLSHHYGQRVDVVLASLFPEFSRSQLSQWLKEGSITLNERHCKPKDKVCGGEHIKLNTTLVSKTDEHQAENMPLSIVFEDEHLLIIDKPAGLVVHPGAGNLEHTLVNALLYHAPELHSLPRAGIVHRLDKDTTGLLIVAKTLTAYTTLVRQLQARDIHRHYTTLVHGHVIAGGLIETCYGRHPRNRLKMAVVANGKEAITQFSLRKQYHHATLLDVKLMTGRTHQIRVHMAHINHPVVGDPLYGGRTRVPGKMSDPLRQALQQFKRQALHASTLSLLHPHNETELTVSTPLPEDFERLLALLEQHHV